MDNLFPAEYKIFLFDFSLFDKSQPENGFIQFERIFNVTNLDNPIQRAHSTASFDINQSNESIESTSNSSENKKYIIIGRHKQLFLAHQYKSIPTTIHEILFSQQITKYVLSNQNFGLAHFQGISFKDWEGNLIPTVLTERPANGPLLSFIERQEMKGQQLTAEQKYAIICGIVDGLSTIHKNGFIHSNLNPTTVYIDNELHPLIVDYIFHLPFNVECETIETDDDIEYKFEYKSDVKTVFDYPHYVAPELKKGEKFGSQSDIYSLGKLILFILTQKEVDDDDVSEIENVDKKWLNLILRCLSSDPEKRPTTKDILYEELLNEKKKIEYINTINSNSKTSNKKINIKNSISENLSFYLSNVLFHANCKFDKSKAKKISLFHFMVPNIVDIDRNTWSLIESAETGDVQNLEKIGGMFMQGENKLQKDIDCASKCYCIAANRGNINAMMKAIKNVEDGFGNIEDLKDAFKVIKKRKKLTSNEIVEIQSRIDAIDEKMKAVILTNVEPTTEPETITGVFGSLKVEDVSKTYSNELKVTFDCIESQQSAVERLKNKEIEINDSQVEFKLLIQKANDISSLISLTKLKRVKLDDFIFCDEKNEECLSIYANLGHGTFGTVYRICKKEDHSQVYVAKILQKNLNLLSLNELKRELMIAPLLSDHPAILKYIGYNEHSLENYIDGENEEELKPTLITEFIPNGTIEDAIKENKIEWNNNTTKLKAILGIANGLAQMFALNITHRDLKPENIMLNERFEPVICDLGNSRQFIFLVHEKKTAYMGTPIYKAPELFPAGIKPEYTYEIDSYSFGILVYQILFNCIANNVYPGITSLNKLIDAKLNNVISNSLNDLHPEFKWVIENCWNSAMNFRPDMPTIYCRLVKAFKESDKPLLPDIDVDDVNKYFETLPEVKFV